MSEIQLVAEKLSHTIDMLRADIRTIKADNEHKQEMYEHRIKVLEKSEGDHETRLRKLQESATKHKVTYSLASGGASILSIIALARTITLGF